MDYDDGVISTTEQALVIRRYSLLLTSKTIPYARIREVRRMQAGWLNARGRIWGTTLPGYWLNFDLRRPAKKVAFVVDAGSQVKPVLTPKDPDGLTAALRDHGVTLRED